MATVWLFRASTHARTTRTYGKAVERFNPAANASEEEWRQSKSRAERRRTHDQRPVLRENRPATGDTVHRFQVRRRHIVGVIAALVLVIVFSGFELIHTRADVSAMQAQSAQQQATLKQIDSQADALRKQLQAVQKQNQEIRQLIGAPPPKAPAKSGTQTSWIAPRTVSGTQARIAALRAQSVAMQQESDWIETLAMDASTCATCAILRARR